MSAKTTLAACAALGILGCAAAARAAPDDTLSVSVSVADLNLDTPVGAEVALRRIHHAANVICGEETDIRVLSRFGLYRRCMRVTVGGAVASMHRPMLTAMNAGPARPAPVLPGPVMATAR